MSAQASAVHQRRIAAVPTLRFAAYRLRGGKIQVLIESLSGSGAVWRDAGHLLLADFETMRALSRSDRNRITKLHEHRAAQVRRRRIEARLAADFDSLKRCVLYCVNGKELRTPWFHNRDRARQALAIIKRKYGEATIYID
ncbi:MAG: hypothetical protein QM661_14745 [Solimonas sp.]